MREDNRWVILSKKFPWEEIDREYQEHFKSSEGQVAIPSRLAFGALYIQAEEGYTDEQTRRNIQENPYLQYFCGFECYTMESPFDASMMTHFRKRISPEMIQRINDLVFAPEAVASTDNPEEDDSVNQEDSEDPLSAQPTEKSENRGTLILDATCCPADIHYPTDVGLLNHARELVEKMIDLLYPAARDLYPREAPNLSSAGSEKIFGIHQEAYPYCTRNADGAPWEFAIYRCWGMTYTGSCWRSRNSAANSGTCMCGRVIRLKTASSASISRMFVLVSRCWTKRKGTCADR